MAVSRRVDHHGGEHHLYAPGEGRTNRAKVNQVGLDVRATGGYVVAPPSVHASGHIYRWASNGLWQPLPPMPAELVDLLWPPATAVRA